MKTMTTHLPLVVNRTVSPNPAFIQKYSDEVRERIAKNACELYEQGGRQDGRELGDWLNAKEPAIRVYQTVWRNVTLNCPAAFMATNAAHTMAAFQTLCQRKLIPGFDGIPNPPDAGGGPPPRLLLGLSRPADHRHRRVAQCHGGGQPDDCHAHPVRGPRQAAGGGVLRDKDIRKPIAHFAKAGARHAIFTRYPGTRATAPDELVPLWQQWRAAPAKVIEEPEEAFTSSDNRGRRGRGDCNRLDSLGRLPESICAGTTDDDESHQDELRNFA